MFIENVLGSKAKVKIIRVLVEVRTAYSLKNLVSETGLSLSITHLAAEELAEEGVLTKIKGTRKERLYLFNSECGFASPLFEFFKIEKTRQRREVILINVWNMLENLLTKIKKDIHIMILFGSQVRGEATLRSDIDILIIPKTEKSELLEKIKKVDPRFNPLFTNINLFNIDRKNKTPFYNNIKNDGLVIFIRKNIKDEIKEFLEDIEPHFVLGQGRLGRTRL